jgi:hypothetical protein
MQRSVAMESATQAFERIAPKNCNVEPTDKPLYTHVKVKGWPSVVHYEFRQHDDALCLELHVEDKKFAYLGDTFKTCAAQIGSIEGYRLAFYTERVGRHRKVWPSLSIELRPDTDSATAAIVMLGLITATRFRVSEALHVPLDAVFH